MLAQNNSPEISSSMSSSSKQMSACSLKWRDRKLIVRAARAGEPTELLLHDFDRLVECLKRSPVELVKLAPDLNSEVLLRWADACAKAKKVCYVSIPGIPELLVNGNQEASKFSKLFYRLFAFLVLLIGSPLFLFVSLLSQMEVGKGVQLKWAIGDRGKLFQTQIWLGGSGWLPYLQQRYTKLIHILKGDLVIWSSSPITLD